jgi:hypothetical protein
MGWRIHRIWSTEWFHDPEQAIAGVLRSVEQAQQAPVETPILVPAPIPDPPAPANPAPQSRPPGTEIPRKYKPGQPYSVFRPPQLLIRDYLLDASDSGILSGTISELVQTEGPIHHDVLVERLKEIHGVARAGSNVQANIERALRESCGSKAVACEAGSGFYDSPGHQLESFRLPTGSVRRPIEQIAPKELELAILYLVENQFGVVEESLPTAIAHLVGIERLRGESAEPIRRVADDLVARGLLRRNGLQLHLA